MNTEQTAERLLTLASSLGLLFELKSKNAEIYLNLRIFYFKLITPKTLYTHTQSMSSQSSASFHDS